MHVLEATHVHTIILEGSMECNYVMKICVFTTFYVFHDIISNQRMEYYILICTIVCAVCRHYCDDVEFYYQLKVGSL